MNPHAGLRTTSKRGRPRKHGGEAAQGTRVTAAFTLDDSALLRIRALLPGMSTPWRKAKLSDALRALTLMGIDAFERMTAEEGMKKREES